MGDGLKRATAAARATRAPGEFTATRDQLVDALTRLEIRVLVSGPAAGMINAESTADAIIEALAAEHAPVHYRWPVMCGSFSQGDLWTGNLDRVTCVACCAAGDRGC